MKKHLLFAAAVIFITTMGAYAQTTNTVAKFNSSGTAVNSSMVDNGSSVSIGNTSSLTINSGTDVLFRNALPKVELWTGFSTTGYSELMTIRHVNSGPAAELRQLGLLFKMGDESAGGTGQMGGMLLETSFAYNNFPSLNFVTNNKRIMTIDYSGKVGIGTTTPLNRFTVTGVTSTVPQNTWLGSNGVASFFGENGSGNADMVLGMADNTGITTRPVFLARRSRGSLAVPGAVQQSDYLGSFLGSGFDGTSFSNPGEISFIVDGPVATNVIPTSIIFGTNSGSGRFERMRVTSSGNIGIGTRNPQLPLSVVAVGPLTGGFFRAVAGGNVPMNNAVGLTAFGVYNTTNSTEINGAFINGVATQAWAPGSAQGTALAFQTTLNNSNAPAEMMRIDNNGFVGIGTKNPQSPLSIVNAAPTTTGFFRSIVGGQIAQHGAVGQTVFGIYNSTNSTELNGAMIRGVATQAWVPGTAQGTGLAFHTTLNNSNVLTEVMRIDNNGFVGIGTPTPREALSVNGSIRSKQVTVETANFPDYVFNPTYQLRTMADVKAYIDKHQRLPEMPSATEVETNGQNLGEINKMLVKKIEELTLYLLQQNERIEKLEKKKTRKKH